MHIEIIISSFLISIIIVVCINAWPIFYLNRKIDIKFWLIKNYAKALHTGDNKLLARTMMYIYFVFDCKNEWRQAVIDDDMRKFFEVLFKEIETNVNESKAMGLKNKK